MKREWEEQLKQLVEAASVKDLLPEFDKEAVWERVTAKQTRRRKIRPGWISHAAAVVVGMLISGFVFSLFSPKAQPVIATAPLSPIAVEVQGNKEDPGNHNALPVHQASVVHTRPVLQQQAIRPGQKKPADPVSARFPDAAPTDVVAPDPMLIEAEQPPAIVQSKPVRRKVMHYLDITSGDAINEQAKPGPTVYLVQVKLNKPEALNSNLSAPPIRGFVGILAH